MVTGASGGVGSAVVQLCTRRGATVVAIAASGKRVQLLDLGAKLVLDRNADVLARLGENSQDVVFDNVEGDGFGDLLQVLRRGGQYLSSGAIGGPLVTLDMRIFYLKDLRLIGCTAWDEPVFPNLTSSVEADEIRPLVAKTFSLAAIAVAQAEFF